MCLKRVNIKKAVISGVIIYALLFLAASALLFTVTDQTIFGTISFLVLVILTAVVMKKYYFKGMKVKKPLQEGLGVGIILVLVFLAIEIPVMVYGFASDMAWYYFTSWDILLGYISLLVVPVLVAWKK